MTRALLPGRWNRDGRAVPIDRHCYMSDEEVRIREERAVAFDCVEDEHNLPAFVWWAVVSVVGIGGFAAGIVLGSAAL